jgi:GAF domain
MSTSDPLGARARFLAAVDKSTELGDEPVRLCEACVLSLPVQRAGIAVHVKGVGLEVLCASDYIAERVEWVQVSLGEGPAWQAIASGGPVVIPDLTALDERWPVFASEASASGVGSMITLPLQVGAIQVGVLDLYRDSAELLGTDDFADAVAVADLVTAILLAVGRTGRITEALGPWWDQPLTTREVHQATGMIMAQLGVDAKSAYVRLQGFAYAGRGLIGDVAHEVVARRLRFDQDPDPDPDPDVNRDPDIDLNPDPLAPRR